MYPEFLTCTCLGPDFPLTRGGSIQEILAHLPCLLVSLPCLAFNLMPLLDSVPGPTLHAFLPGGNMAEYVTKKIPYGGGMCMGEDEARFFFTQILNAIEYCHQHQVAHR